MDTIWLETVLIFVAILVNGFFAGSEIALVSARTARLTHLRDESLRGAAAALSLKADPETFLATIQIAFHARGHPRLGGRWGHGDRGPDAMARGAAPAWGATVGRAGGPRPGHPDDRVRLARGGGTGAQGAGASNTSPSARCQATAPMAFAWFLRRAIRS